MITSSHFHRFRTRLARRHGQWRLIVLLFGGVLATGAHWDALQVFAWGRMFAISLENETPAEALATLFSPEKRCDICRVVSEAKADASDGSETAAWFIKAPLIIPAFQPVMVSAPLMKARQRLLDALPLQHFGEAPPVPPPQVIA